MPIDIRTKAAAGGVYPSPFVGPIDHTAAIRVDVSTLGTAEVDQYGYIKPGVILQENGGKISAPAQVAYGAVVEAIKIAADNAAATLAAAADKDVALARFVALNQDIAEDILGRALTADEVAAVKAAGSHLTLI